MRLQRYELGERELKIQKPFMKGTDVRRLQQHLKAMGFLNGRVDGIFGYETKNALKNFQKKYGLHITGCCFQKGDRTLEKINELFADRYLDWPVYQKNPQHTGYTPFKILPPLRLIRRIKYNETTELRTFGNYILTWSPEKIKLIRNGRKKPMWEKKIEGNLYCPNIDNNIIFIQCGNGVIALDPTKGEKLWNHTEDVELTFSPLPYKEELIITAKNGLCSIDQLTGKKLWSYSMGDMFSLQPAAAKGLITAIYGRIVYAVDAKTGTEVWKRKLSHIVDVLPVIEGDTIYIVSGGNKFYALKLEDGEYEWKGMMGKGSYYSPAVRHSVLYLSSIEGVLACCENGSIRWFLDLPVSITTPPIITKDNIFIGTEDGLISLGLDGDVVWEGLKGNNIKSIAVYKYQLIAADDNTIYIFSGT